jgi:hypothetical protein
LLGDSPEPDPHRLAETLMQSLTRNERDAALASCLADRIRIRIHIARRPSVAPLKTGRSRWTRHAERYCIDGRWLFLIDCTAADCDWLADDYQARARAMLDLESEFRDLAERVRRAGVRTVGELRAMEDAA